MVKPILIMADIRDIIRMKLRFRNVEVSDVGIGSDDIGQIVDVSDHNEVLAAVVKGAKSERKYLDLHHQLRLLV